MPVCFSENKCFCRPIYCLQSRTAPKIKPWPGRGVSVLFVHDPSMCLPIKQLTVWTQVKLWWGKAGISPSASEPGRSLPWEQTGFWTWPITTFRIAMKCSRCTRDLLTPIPRYSGQDRVSFA